MATEFKDMFSAIQPCQDVKVCGRFRDWLHSHLQSVTGGLVKPKLITRCPTLFCVYLLWAWVQDEMGPLWLVGGVKRSLHLAWTVYWWNALHNQQYTAQGKCHELLTTPTKQTGHNPSCAHAQQRYTQHRVEHLVISLGFAMPPATPCRWGWSQPLKHRITFISWCCCLTENISLNLIQLF